MGCRAGADAGVGDRRFDRGGALSDRRGRQLHLQVRPHGGTLWSDRRPDRGGTKGGSGLTRALALAGLEPLVTICKFGGRAMHVIRRREWEIPERLATPEHLFLNRRAFLAATGAVALSLSPKTALAQRVSDLPDPTTDPYPAKATEKFTRARPI